MKQSAKIITLLTPIPTLLIVWELVSRSGIVNTTLFPPPSRVYLAFIEMIRKDELGPDIIASVKRAVVGYILGCLIGIIFGILTGRSRLAERICGQLIHILRAFPPVAIVPFAILWFGLAESSKYFLVAWGVFFPVWINTHMGIAQIDRTYLWVGRNLGADREQLILDVLLPASLPHILAGMRAAIGICFICVFVAEMAGAYEGVGFRISTSYLVFRVDKMIACLLVLGSMGAGADIVFKWICRTLFPWTSLENRG